MRSATTELVAAVLALACASPALARAATCTWTDVALVEGQATPVTQAALERPYLSARFGEGTFYSLSACETQAGLLFLGTGELDVRDPGPQRGPQLHLRSEDLPGTILFEAAVIWASDGAVRSLLEQAEPTARGPVPTRARAMLTARSDGFRRELNRAWLPPGEVLWAPEEAQGGVLAEFRTAGLRWERFGSLEAQSPWLSYLWAPTGALGDPHEPGLWLRRSTGSTLGVLLSGFPSEEDVSAANTPFALHRPERAWDLLSAEIGVALSGPMGLKRVLETVTGDARLELAAGERATRQVQLELSEGRRRQYDEQFAELEVAGVAMDEAALPWTRAGDRLWVELPEDPTPGDRITLRVKWSGRILENRGETAVTALGSDAWYPRPPGNDRHRATTTVAVPPAWDVIATGHRIGEEVDAKVRIVTSRSNHPVPWAGVVVGDVRTEVVRPAQPGLPLIRLHRSPAHPAANARVGDELVEHLVVLTELLGPYPWSELELVERGGSAGGLSDVPGVVAVGHWDSPPKQMVTTQAGGDSALGAVIRQWLELELGATSDHDRWLIEGLVGWARCFALEAAGRGGRCYGTLQGARRAWLDRLDGIADPGAIALLGNAVWLDATSGGSWANRTQRGPLVLHMLRMLVGDEVVRSALGRLMVAYGGQGLSLSSFLVQVQAQAGADLRPFVYGWVFNTPTLPEAHVAYRLEETADGWSLIATGRIDDGLPTTPDVPLPTPLLLSFTVNGESHARRIVLSEVEAEVRIDGIPDKPRDVRLDPAGTFPGRTKVKRVKE